MHHRRFVWGGDADVHAVPPDRRGCGPSRDPSRDLYLRVRRGEALGADQCHGEVQPGERAGRLDRHPSGGVLLGVPGPPDRLQGGEAALRQRTRRDGDDRACATASSTSIASSRRKEIRYSTTIDPRQCARSTSSSTITVFKAVGRYGEHKYLMTDACVISARRAAERTKGATMPRSTQARCTYRRLAKRSYTCRSSARWLKSRRIRLR